MKIFCILNPISGNRNNEETKSIILECLNNSDNEFIIQETKAMGDAENLAKEAISKDFDCIIAIGGDGTINEIINVIANTKISLGIISSGTGNLLATSLGIPMNIKEAFEIIKNGYSKQMDLGRVNGKYFSMITGCGFDAEIMNNVSKQDKKSLGIFAYFWEGIKQSFIHKKAVFKVIADGKTIKKRGVNVLIINIANIFGNFISLVPNASMHDGMLDICIFSPRNTAEFIPILWDILTKQDMQNINHKTIYHSQAKKIKLISRPKLRIQADGDVIGYSPIEIEVIPKALTVIVPEKHTTFMMDPQAFFMNIIEKLFIKNNIYNN